MSKRIIFIAAAAIAILFLVLLGVFLGMKFHGSQDPSGPSEYSAVYLSTGDMYFGKLDWFPWPRLTDVWYLGRSQGQNGQELSLAPLKNAFWAPTDEIYLNPKEVVFWARLRNNSQVVSAIRGSASGAQALPSSALGGIPQPPQSSNPPPAPPGAGQ